jgi:hypothetical protein
MLLVGVKSRLLQLGSYIAREPLRVFEYGAVLTVSTGVPVNSEYRRASGQQGVIS